MSNLQVPDPGLLAKMQGFLDTPNKPAVLDLQAGVAGFSLLSSEMSSSWPPGRCCKVSSLLATNLKFLTSWNVLQCFLISPHKAAAFDLQVFAAGFPPLSTLTGLS